MSLPWTIPGGQQVQRSVHRIGGSEGGPVIVRGYGAMESENFQTGVAGWQFDAQGNLEANNGNFRGDISGASGTFSGELKSGTDPNSFTTSGGAIWSGAAAFGSAPFRVTPTGFVYAEGYYLLDGTIQQGTMTISNGIASNVDIGGAATIIPTGQLASDNYVSGTSGWAIDGDGDAEFNNVTLRGSLVTADSGRAISIGASNAAFIDLTTGDGDEVDNGYLNVDVDNSGADDFGYINLVAPQFSAGGPRAYIDIRHAESGTRSIGAFSDLIELQAEEDVVINAFGAGGDVVIQANDIFTLGSLNRIDVSAPLLQLITPNVFLFGALAAQDINVSNELVTLDFEATGDVVIPAIKADSSSGTSGAATFTAGTWYTLTVAEDWHPTGEDAARAWLVSVNIRDSSTPEQFSTGACIISPTYWTANAGGRQVVSMSIDRHNNATPLTLDISAAPGAGARALQFRPSATFSTTGTGAIRADITRLL
jgi:hypothetical protein